MTEFLESYQPKDKPAAKDSANPLLSLNKSEWSALSAYSAKPVDVEAVNTTGEETFSDKLNRQVSVLGGGIVDGTVDGLGKAVTDPLTVVKAGLSFGAGALLTAMHARKGKFRVAAQTVGVGLGGVFAKDVYDHGSAASEILSQSWNDPYGKDHYRAQMAGLMGPLVTDTLIYTAGGVAGVRYAGKPRNVVTFDGIARDPLYLKPANQGKEWFKPLAAQEESTGFGQKLAQAFRRNKNTEPEHVEFRFADLSANSAREAYSVKISPDNGLGMPVAKNQKAIAKAEVLTYSPEQGLGGGTATAFAYSKDGKFAVNNHLIEGARDIVLIDSKGFPRPAHVTHQSHKPQDVDLAIVQLNNPAHMKHFEAAKLDLTTPEAESGLLFLGHLGGSNQLHVSRGLFNKSETINMRGISQEFTTRYSCRSNVAGGNCGSLVTDLSGRVKGIMNGDLYSAGDVRVIPSAEILSLGRGPKFSHDLTLTTTRVEPLSVANPQIKTFKVDDVPRAKATIDGIFGVKIDKPLPDLFFHVRGRQNVIETAIGSENLVLSTRFIPKTNEVVVKPIAIGNRQLKETEFWPGTEIPMSSAELRLSFDKKFTNAKMQSINDPLGALNSGLAFRGFQPSYLSTLEGATLAMPTPPAMPYYFGLTGLGTRKPLLDLTR